MCACTFRYDVAISTACSMLDAFVVQAQADAKAVFDALRAMGGRARLIILDELSEELLTLMSRSVATPKGCARLFDLVRTDAKFQPAFYKVLFNRCCVFLLLYTDAGLCLQVLGNTLVADTTENAQVAAYGRDRSGKVRCQQLTACTRLVLTCCALCVWCAGAVQRRHQGWVVFQRQWHAERRRQAPQRRHELLPRGPRERGGGQSRGGVPGHRTTRL